MGSGCISLRAFVPTCLRASLKLCHLKLRAPPDHFQTGDLVNRVAEAFLFDAMSKSAIFADQLILQLVAVFDCEVNLRRVLALFAGLLGGRFDSFDRVHFFDGTCLVLGFHRISFGRVQGSGFRSTSSI